MEDLREIMESDKEHQYNPVDIDKDIDLVMLRDKYHSMNKDSLLYHTNLKMCKENISIRSILSMMCC